MDLQALLPLLLRRNGKDNDPQTQTLTRLMSGERPSPEDLLKMAASPRTQPLGLRVAVGIASPSILGKLTAHFLTSEEK